MTYLGNWFIVQPVEKFNLVTNPSFERATTGYSAINGGVLARTTDYQKRGLYSGRYTPSANVNDGVQYSITLAAATEYTFSVDVKGADGRGYKVDIYDNTGAVILGSALAFVSDGEWNRYAVTVTIGSNTAIRLRVYKNNHANTDSFYVDGFQCEPGDGTTYIDGDEPGCTWLAGEHSSQSVRSGQYRGGGRWVSLLDGCKFAIEQQFGTGMAPIRVITQPRGQGGGSIYSDSVEQERSFSLAGKIQGRTDTPRGIRSLHASRKKIVNLTKPDLVTPKQPYRLAYIGAGGAVAIDAHYSRGLDLNETSGPALEAASLVSVATNPLWQRVERMFTASDIANGLGTGDSDSDGAGAYNGGGGGNQAVALSVQDEVEDANGGVWQDTAGQWHSLGAGFTLPTPGALNGRVLDTAIGLDGSLYVAGEFTTAGGDTVNRIARWDGADWFDLDGGANNIVRCLAVDPDTGILYAGGDFTTIGGVSANRIAAWDGTVWDNLGTGANGAVLALAIDSVRNYLYLGGAFTQAGGVADTSHVAFWDIDGSNYEALEQGVNGNVNTLVVRESDGVLFAGGEFTTASSNTAVGFAIHDPTIIIVNPIGWTANNIFLTGIVNDMAVAPDGSLYVVGNFASADLPATTTVNHIVGFTSYNATAGFTGFAVGEGLGAPSNAIVIDPAGNVYVGGEFTDVDDGVSANYIAKWSIDDEEWSALGEGTDDEVFHLQLTTDGQLYVGGDFTEVGDGLAVDNFARWNGIDWRTVGVGVKAIMQASDGSVYFGGGFSSADGVANTSRIARWIPSTQTFEALSSGADGVVYAIVEAANGDIIIGGSFNEVGGVADTRGIARYVIATDTWEPLDTGVAGVVFALAFSPDSRLYVGGLFPTASGINAKNLAYWDGNSFFYFGSPNGAVNSIVISPDSAVYIAGAFTVIENNSRVYIAKIVPGVAVSSLSTGLNAYATDLALLPDGRLVVIGNFTLAGGQDCAYIALWNGSGFAPCGTGLSAPGKVVATTPDGQIYAGGLFTEAGGIELPDKAAVFSNNTWKPIGINLPGTAAVEAILITQAGEIYLGFDTEGTATGQAVS